MALTEPEVFSRADEHLLEDFAVYCALGLQKFNTQQTAHKTRAKLAVTKEVLSYQISASQKEIDTLEEAVIPSADVLRLLDFDFSDFDMSQTAMTPLSNQPLAQLYGHSSLEHHHYDMCLLILNNPGSQILSSLSLKEYRACAQMIEKNILATDLAIYIEKRTMFFKLAQNNSCLWKDEGHRELLRSMLMTASDMCGITKPWPVQKWLAELVATEFYAQGDREKCEFNIQSNDMMDCKNSIHLPHMQVDYIEGICSPL